MSEVKWEDGTFCSVGGKQWKHGLVDDICIVNLITRKDFQLNEIRRGDYIEASELDTEQKYNDAVEVLGLSGFAGAIDWKGQESYGPRYFYVDKDTGEFDSQHYFYEDDMVRKITYPQLMAIGKLQRAIIQRDEVLIEAVENTLILKDTLDAAKDYISIEGEKLNPLAESAEVETVCGKPKEEFVKAINKVNTLEGLLCTPQAASDCKELNINLVITGEGRYILDRINGVEYAVYTKDDYDKVVGAIRLLMERER